MNLENLLYVVKTNCQICIIEIKIIFLAKGFKSDS